MRVLLLLMPLFLLYAQQLSTLIDHAQKNDLVNVRKHTVEAAKHELDSVEYGYLPRIDLGANGQYINDAGSFQPGETYSEFATASFTVLDGFKRENLIDEKEHTITARSYDLKSIKKEMSLKITELYFGLMNVQQNITAQEQQKKQLSEQLRRQKKFHEAGIVAEDEVQRINAAYLNSVYELEVLKYDADEFKAMLKLYCGLDVDNVHDGKIKEPENTIQVNELDYLRAMEYDIKALQNRAEIAVADYYPTLSISDSYSFYQYGSFNPPIPDMLPYQNNNLMFNASINLIDFSSASQQKQAIQAQKLARVSQLAFDKKEANEHLLLALKAIERSKASLKAAYASYEASTITLDVISKQYDAHIVDYIKYLDALTQKTRAEYEHNRAKSALQNAYARYYYYAGYDIKEFVDE